VAADRNAAGILNYCGIYHVIHGLCDLSACCGCPSAGDGQLPRSAHVAVEMESELMSGVHCVFPPFVCFSIGPFLICDRFAVTKYLYKYF
jgi:hypothetical protein